MNIFLIISSVFFTMLALGFFIGFFRGWCKSLIRLGITIANIALSLLISPLITGAFTSKVTSGSEISIFSLSIDLGDVFNDIIGSDITLSQSTTNLLATAIANIVVNIILFLVIFLFIQITSLIIYWIIVLVLHLKCKEDQEPQNIGLRCLGGIQGMVGAVAILFVILVPFFGFINILDKTTTEPINDNIPQANAVAMSNNFLCGELFYDSEEMNKIDSYIDSYASFRKQYNSTAMGVILKYTGIQKLGIFSFNRLTNINISNQNISFTNEASSVIEVFNSAKTLLNDNLDYTSNKFIESVRDVYDNATKSIFIQRYLTDLVPVWAEKWSNNEKFFNFDNPIPSEYQETTNYLLKAIASVQDFSKLNRNFNKIFDTVIILNEHNIITLLTDGQDIITILSNDKTIVKEVLFTLSRTEELQNSLPNTLNSSLGILYDNVVGDGKFVPYFSDSLSVDFDWETETDNIQNIVNEFLNTYNSLSSSETVNSEHLVILGKSIDTARTSVLLSTSLKSFIIGFIESDSIDIDPTLKINLVDLINEKWDITENPDYSFELAFSSILETEKIADVVLNNINASSSEDIQDIDMSSLSSTIKNIVSDDVSKNLVLSIIKNEELVDQYIGSDTISNAIVDTLASFIENTSSETIDTDLDALTSIVNIISSNQNITELSTKDCDNLITSISNSTTMINVINEAITSEETSPLKSLVSNIGEDNLNNLSASIENVEISAENKAVLNKLFNNQTI